MTPTISDLEEIIKAGVLTNIDYEEQPRIIAEQIYNKYFKPQNRDSREQREAGFNDAYAMGIDVY